MPPEYVINLLEKAVKNDLRLERERKEHLRQVEGLITGKIKASKRGGWGQ